MAKENLSIKDKIAIVASIVALGLSLYAFVRDTLLNQHVLRASVVSIDEKGDRLLASILLVNAGKHYETLYKARFIYSDDLSTGGGATSNEFVGPIVVKPGEAVVLTLDASKPNIQKLRDDGTIKNPKSGIHLGVIFDPLTPSGQLKDDSKIFRFTELLFSGSERAGSKPRPGDNDRLIDLL
ncbi:MAG: hypothetical protein JWM21_4491 [Acidobacteria bacterium]|nr:hypothetical protein [Acidobacteriota bacterium]